MDKKIKTQFLKRALCMRSGIGAHIDDNIKLFLYIKTGVSIPFYKTNASRIIGMYEAAVQYGNVKISGR